MKNITILTTLILCSTFVSAAHATFLPATTPQTAPTLKCTNQMAEIPESRLSVQVYPGTQENPYAFVKVEKLNTNSADMILFAGGVTERPDDNATLLFAPGMNMKISQNASGSNEATLQGTITLKKGENLKFFAVNCETVYQIMPIKQPQTM